MSRSHQLFVSSKVADLKCMRSVSGDLHIKLKQIAPHKLMQTVNSYVEIAHQV